MNRILESITGLRQRMTDWIDSHDNADGWFECMYFGRVKIYLGENEPTRYGFDWINAYSKEMQRNYPVVRCPECGDTSDVKSCGCDCEEEKLDDDEAIEWWAEFVSDTGCFDEIVATSVLLEEGYPQFVRHFGLENFFEDTRKSLDDFEDIQDADDALVWFLAAAHVQHYGGFHLQTLDGWNELECWRLCDGGLDEVFEREVVDEFIETFDLERLNLSPFQLEQDEEAELDLCKV